MAAFWKCVFFSGLATPEDYAAAGAYVPLVPAGSCLGCTCKYSFGGNAGDPACPAIKSIPAYPPLEWLREHYPRGETGTGAVHQLTLRTVVCAFNRELTPLERHFLLTNIGEPEWSVASLLLGATAFTPPGRWAVLHVLGSIRVSCWREAYADVLVAIKRVNRTIPQLPPRDIMLLRNILNCSYRTHAQADWEAEYTRRTDLLPAHMQIGPDGWLSREIWEAELWEVLKDIARKVVSQTAESCRLDPLPRWWARRWQWTPGGSSSNRHCTDALRLADPRLGSRARPDKKAVFETLDEEWLIAGLASRPAYIARTSTKPEPGGKARALYAVDDRSFVVTAYPSAQIEKHMMVDGMHAQQLPADVVEWTASHRGTLPGEVWLSLDYSDFNSDHELQTLAWLNAAFAVAWSGAPLPGEVRRQKAFCAAWAAAGHRAAFAELPEPYGAVRVFGGLFSGDRDTARDNTLLHAAYSQLAQRARKRLDPFSSSRQPYYCGDDEDMIHSDWVGGLLYYLVHAYMGFTLKPSKQLCSHNQHEFLRRMIYKEELPTMPLFTAMAQFASGNWYHDVYTWHAQAIDSTNANILELVRRGLGIEVGRRLASLTLDAIMRIRKSAVPETVWGTLGIQFPEGAEYHHLEWWSFRHGSMMPHPLWIGTQGETRMLPSIAVDWGGPHTAASSHAVDDWIAEMVRVAPRLPKGILRRYRDGCMARSYGKFYAAYRAQMAILAVITRWPSRWSWPSGLDAPPPPMLAPQRLTRLIETTRAPRRPPTAPEVYARMGVEAELVGLLGGMPKLLPLLGPQALLRYETPQEPPPPNPLLWAYEGALIAWANPLIPPGTTMDPHGKRTLTISSSSGLHNPHLRNPPRLLSLTASSRFIVFAPNAAGKTTIQNLNPWIQDIDLILTQRKLSSLARMSTLSSSLSTAPIAEAVDWELTTGGFRVLMSQFHPSAFLRERPARGYSISVIIYEPPIALLTARMAARGWEPEKIRRRLERWELVKQQISRSLVLTAEEKSSAKTASSLGELQGALGGALIVPGSVAFNIN